MRQIQEDQTTRKAQFAIALFVPRYVARLSFDSYSDPSIEFLIAIYSCQYFLAELQ